MFSELPDSEKVKFLLNSNLRLLSEIKGLHIQIDIQQKEYENILKTKNIEINEIQKLKSGNFNKTMLKLAKKFIKEKGLSDEFTNYINKILNQK